MAVSRKKFMVLDVDACLLAPGDRLGVNQRPDLLSPELIRFAKQHHYDGFYLCTHRSVALLYQSTFEPNKVAMFQQAVGYDVNPVTLLTHVVANNFSQATGLPLQKISTPDDSSVGVMGLNVGERCGAAFEKVTRALEMKLASAAQPLSLEGFYGLCSQIPDLGLHTVGGHNSYTKNNQLEQIAHYVAQQFPQQEVELDYFDDMNYLCDKALISTADKAAITKKLLTANETKGTKFSYEEMVQGAMQLDPGLLPANIKAINVYQHAFYDNIYTHLVGSVKPAQSTTHVLARLGGPGKRKLEVEDGSAKKVHPENSSGSKHEPKSRDAMSRACRLM